MAEDRKAMEGPATQLSTTSIVRRYYGVWLAYSLAGGFLGGVYPLFLRARGLNQLEINSVLAVYFAVAFLFDVPTGAFADALGRRRSFIVGCVLRCLAFGLYFLSHTYVLFLVAEAIDAIGTTFCNGAIDAWGVDALDEAGFEGTKHGLFSRISQLSSLGFMATALIGAFVGSVDIAWPWLLGAAGFLLSALAGTLLHERPRDATGQGHRAIRAAVRAQIGSGLRQGFGIRSIRLLSLAEAITLGVMAPYWLQWPLLFKDGYGAGVWVVGWVFCVLGLGKMLGAEAAARILTLTSARPRLLSGLTIGTGLTLLGAGFLAARPNQALVLLFLMNAFQGVREPLALAWFNEEVAPEARATMLSFRGMMATAGGAIGLLLGGYVTDLWGIPFAWKVAGALCFLVVPCYLTLRRRGKLRFAV
ncbi:MAG TPA: MFS transporter [Terriglobales bacterium]|nr:MFS transporter [Terriglobales bacterium]